jgi:hypothetical protein
MELKASLTIVMAKNIEMPPATSVNHSIGIGSVVNIITRYLYLSISISIYIYLSNGTREAAPYLMCMDPTTSI